MGYDQTLLTSGGKKALKSETILVGMDVQSLSEAFEYINRYAHTKGARFTVQLPSSEDDHFQEFLDLRDVDYGNVTIEGAFPFVAITTSMVISGSAPNFNVTLNFEPSTYTEEMTAGALKAGAAVLHIAGDPGTAADGAFAGYWPVASVTNSSITLSVKVRGTISSPAFTTQQNLVEIFPSMFKPRVVGGAKKGLMAAVDAVAPRLKWVGFNGQKYIDGDGVPNVIQGENAIFRFGEGDSSNIDPGLCVTGANSGISIYNGSKAMGTAAISDCLASGSTIGYGSIFTSRFLISTGNVSHGALVSQGAILSVSPYNGSYLSAFSGNGGSGVVAQEAAQFHSISAHVAANAAAAQLLAQNNAWMVIGGTTQSLIVGSTSPNVNLNGNSNAYIKRY